MAKIDMDKITKVEGLIHDLLFTHVEEIDKAFMASEEGVAKVNLPVTFKIGKKGFQAEVGISFSMGKVSEKLETSLEQMEMFNGKDGE